MVRVLIIETIDHCKSNMLHVLVGEIIYHYNNNMLRVMIIGTIDHCNSNMVHVSV